MLDGSTVVSRLETQCMEDASSDILLRHAVKQIAAASDRFDWVGIYLLADDILTLHNYVGEPTDHTRIAVGAV